MIDWATVIVPCRHSRVDLDGGVILRTGPGGEVETRWDRPVRLRGSWDSSTLVNSHGIETQAGPLGVIESATKDRFFVRFDGNPTKWRWGQNVCGTDDPRLVFWWVEDVAAALGLFLSGGWQLSARLTRLDVTKSFRLRDDDEVTRWLRAAEQTATMKYRGRGNIGRGSTVYWGKHSRRWSLKAYSKGKELVDHPLPFDLPDRQSWIDYCAGLLRIECCFRSMELKRLGREMLSFFDASSVEALWCRAMENLNLGLVQSVGDLPDVGRGALSTLYQWQCGIDPQGLLPRSTWYRHRRELLAHGVDIAVPASAGVDRPGLASVVAEPVAPPVWFVDQDFRLAA